VAGSEPTSADRIHLVLTRIPRGKVTTYGTVAELAGLPRQARLVGRTLSALPARSRIPWHRVLNASLTISQRGDPLGVAEQRRRLEREGVRFSGNRVARSHLWTP
jgi:methylated-DNA-protein-cysteine methyltransferase-like protein